MKRSDRVPPPPLGRRWAVLALPLVIAPHLTRLPIGLSVLCLGVVGWYLARERYGWALPGTALRLTLIAAGAAGVLASHHGGLSRDAGITLLAVMLSLKLLELRTLRDAMVLVMLSFFLLAGGLLYSQSIPSALHLLVSAAVLTGAMVALNHPGGGLPEVRRHLRTAGLLLLQALPLALLLFLLFPRIPGPLWGLPDQGSGARIGLAGDLRLGEFNRLSDSDAVAFRVDFDGAIPPADRLYWRGPVLWHTDGRRWTRLSQRERAALPPVAFRPLGPAVAYAVTIEPYDGNWIFALDLPANVPQGALAGGAYQLLARRKLRELHRYRLTSYTRYRTGELDPAERRLALALPAGTNPRTRALAARWRAQSASPAAVVDRALAYFRDNPFFYTHRPPLLGADPVDRFLFDTRRGYCEHYAAAFTTLMRAAGVPARVVTGYQGGELNTVGHYLVVRQNHAHAWSEVWLEGRGWIRIDPTAVIPPQRVERADDLSRFRSVLAPADARTKTLVGRGWNWLREGLDTLNHSWNQWVLGYNPRLQSRLLRALGLGRLGWGPIVAILAGGMALLLALVTRGMPRRRSQPDPALRLYRRFCRRLARRGIVRGAGEPAGEFAGRVAALRPDLALAADRITRLYNALRYGPSPRADRLRQLAVEVRRFRP